jgi:hypothetical protein
MRILVAIVLAFALLGHGQAEADRVGRLVKILMTDPSYKVRLQVAITLGKLKAKNAVPALMATLRDPNETVQGVAAAALGQIGDSRAKKALVSLIGRTSNSFVKSQAQKALKRLGSSSGGGAAPAANTRFFVTIGKMSNKSGKGGKQLSKVFSSALTQEFGKVRGVATRWTGGATRPSAAALRKRRVKGFMLDGAITSLSHSQRGSNITISCAIRVYLATYPGKSMKAFYSGGASMAVPARGFNPANASGIYKDLIKGAASGAKQHIVQSYLSRQ